MYDDILVPTDGSDGVEPAIDHAFELAAHTDATVHGLFVVETADVMAIPEAQWIAMEEALEAAGREAVADLEARATRRGVPVATAVRRGTPHEEIVAHADENDADLIVMGTHGRSGLDRVLLGSVTENVIRRAETPVLVRRIDETH